MATKRKAQEMDIPQSVKDATDEYAKGLEARSDMTEEQREEAVRHYQAGLMKFHKAD